MKKSDLKNRMVVELRNGERRMVCDNMLMGFDYSENLDNYNRDLTCILLGGGKDYDIVKVYKEINIIMARESDISPLWERPKIKEVTMEEIEEKLGCKVKIVMGEPII